MGNLNCLHHTICGLEGQFPGSYADSFGYCILHFPEFNKDRREFDHAFGRHCRSKGNFFRHIVFPEYTTLPRVSIAEKGADFTHAMFNFSMNLHDINFNGSAMFDGATFRQGADFHGSTFSKHAGFSSATFSHDANFDGVTFCDTANFTEATFNESANPSFRHARFYRRVSFGSARFRSHTDFTATCFKDGMADFSGCQFRGRTYFVGEENKLIFAEANYVNFRDAVIEPLDMLTFINADLRRCWFVNTDLRQTHFTGVQWPYKNWGRGRLVYDELGHVDKWLWVRRCLYKLRNRSFDEPEWSRLERLYRELKQNYEDRRDYELAGEFHYGEKEMRRRNPETRWSSRLLLTLYWLISGYGERLLPPIAWAGGVWAVATVGYILLGLSSKSRPWETLSSRNITDWFEAAVYSLQVTTFFRPQDYLLVGVAKALYTIQSLLGPLFLGLFALAVRQRLKR